MDQEGSFNENFIQGPEKRIKEACVGVWALEEIYYTTPNDPRIDSFGVNPKGRLRFDADGTFTLQIMRADLPKFASNNRMAGTTEENKAVVQGTMSYFGMYSVSEREQILTFYIEICSYPNFDETIQKRPFTLNGDVLTFINKISSIAGMSGFQRWKRIK